MSEQSLALSPEHINPDDFCRTCKGSGSLLTPNGHGGMANDTCWDCGGSNTNFRMDARTVYRRGEPYKTVSEFLRSMRAGDMFYQGSKIMFASDVRHWRPVDVPDNLGNLFKAVLGPT